MPKLPAYLPVLTSLRGWAATAVCLYHFVWGTVDYIQAPLVRAFAYWGQYGVTVFFSISALVLSLSLVRRDYRLSQWRSFMKRRLWRLEPMYLVSLVLVLGVLWAKASYHHQCFIVSSWNLLLHVGYWVPFAENETWLNPVYWSLAVEFQYYLLLSIVFGAWRNDRLRWVSWVLLLGASWWSADKELVLRWLPIFVGGTSYVLWRCQWLSGSEMVLVGLASAVSLGVQLGIAHVVAALLPVLLVQYCPTYQPYWSTQVGRWSYSLYLVHLPIGQTLVNLLSHHLRTSWQQGLVLFLGYGISLFVAGILYNSVEILSQKRAQRVKG